MVLVRPDHVAVGAVVLRVDVEDRLRVVVAGGQVAETPQRIADGARVDDRMVARLELVNVGRKERNPAHAHSRRLVRRDPRLHVAAGVQGDEDAARDRLPIQRRGEADFEPRRRRMTAPRDAREGEPRERDQDTAIHDDDSPKRLDASKDDTEDGG